jgi:alkylhydroperoxidase family enzyme
MAMARLPYLDKSDLLPEHQDLLARNINLYRLLAHSPRGARSLNTLARYIRDGSRLDPRLRQLAVLQVGYITGSAYEYSHHIRISRDFEVTDDDIVAIAEETAGQPSSLDPLARAVLRATRDLTRNLKISDQIFADLRQGLDDEQLIDLFITIGHYNALVRLMAALEIDVEDEYLLYLDKFPLPKV